MAEFVDIMKIAKRMCDYYHADNHLVACPICPLRDDNNRCAFIDFDEVDDVAGVQEIILRWAEEHPEPRWPSWKQAWASLFPEVRRTPCVMYFMSNEEYHKYCAGKDCDDCMGLPIPADIAKKLGIKPIGGDAQ